MADLSQLSPQPLWNLFAKICAIPHPSYHEEALAQQILQWAKEKNISAERDAVGNLLLRKPATPGMENRTPVVLQAHLDMVPQKNSETEHDFTQDPIRPYQDGEWIKAQGTTLGADNGIGMASALAVLLDENCVHGPLEVLLTMTEEAGMDGAFGLQPNWLQGEILINTDSEQEGEIYMGCAGGIDVITTLPLQRETLPGGFLLQKISLKGLRGGHSGCDIHHGRGNANKLVSRFLSSVATQFDLRLLTLGGGTLRNAIPREAFATLALPHAQLKAFAAACRDYEVTLKQEYAAVEPNLVFTSQSLESHSDLVLTRQSQAQLINLINASPNGVIRMSDELSGVVETSLNLGVITVEEKQAKLVSLIRSQVDSGKEQVVSMLFSLGALAGAEVVAEGSYPGWKPDTRSPIMQVVRDTYQTLFNATPDIMVIHAGLECGLFKKPYPDMDMVSIGPTIRNPHSPDERVHIESVGKYWQLLTALLKAIPVKS